MSDVFISDKTGGYWVVVTHALYMLFKDFLNVFCFYQTLNFRLHDEKLS